eukprot:Lithocolla_globosa_v1_NODE_3852_length_1564_cov_28.912525.p1 type:complete len:312 gc:universal NODE_3852_length_1564_cov_28.912525:1033-98(-)
MNDNFLQTFCGSPSYSSPEIFLNEPYRGPEVDVWSMGIILFMLVACALPFGGKNLLELRDAVVYQRHDEPSFLSPEIKTLLRKLLNKNPKDRESLNLFLHDPWINLENQKHIQFSLQSTLLENEAVVNYLSQQHDIPVEKILESLRNDVFDDIAALYSYYSQAFEKGGNLKLQNQAEKSEECDLLSSEFSGYETGKRVPVHINPNSVVASRPLLAHRSRRLSFSGKYFFSTKPLDEITTECKRCMDTLHLKYTMENLVFIITDSLSENLQIKMEIFCYPFLRAHALRLHRISGRLTEYKDLCKQILNVIKL